MGALALVSNTVFHARTKYIEIDYHFIREKVVNRDIAIKFVASSDQVADIYTKGLSTSRFLFVTSSWCSLPPFACEGGVTKIE